MIRKTDLVKDTAEWGTFRDSLKAPIHRWFTYPAGFSFKAVARAISYEKLKPEGTIYDPFMGSGTTNLVAKSLGINSKGVEAHPFVFPITESKMFWDIDAKEVEAILIGIEKKIKGSKPPSDLVAYLKTKFPELVLKCYLPETLFELLIVRDSIRKLNTSEEIERFLNVALIGTLRDVSMAATGWPYIAPKKIKITSKSKKGFISFKEQAILMLGDLQTAKNNLFSNHSKHDIYLGDSRDTTDYITSKSVDLIFTSPPYLNNFDYADRTRLEMYFMGDAKDWGDISRIVRTVLITSATTQISRQDEKYNFLEGFIKECPEPYSFLKTAVGKLAILRNQKGGKKSYDLLVAGYFNDMYQILKDNFRVLKKGANAYYILGDSAPYGVHIPTDKLIGDIGKCIGFKSYKVIELRSRGGKWANNPQRHSVPLTESIIVLSK